MGIAKEQDDTGGGSVAIVAITRSALQTLLSGGTADTTVIYRVTNAVGSTLVLDVFATANNAISGLALDQTNLRYLFYNISADTIIDLYINAVSSPATGDMLYFNGTSWAKLAAGTAGYVLQANGAAAPVWTAKDTRYAFLAAGGDITTSSDTESNATGLSLSVAANTKYKITLTLAVGCNNTGGLKLGYTFPTSSSFMQATIGRTSAATAVTNVGQVYTANTGLINAIYQTANADSGMIQVEAVLFTGANAGTFQVTFASAVNGQTSKIRELSTLEMSKMA
jgi:hypothetical protein